MNIVDALNIGNKLAEADAAQPTAQPAQQAQQPAVTNNVDVDTAVQKMSQGIQASVTEAIKPVLDELKKLQTGIENLVNGKSNEQKTAEQPKENNNQAKNAQPAQPAQQQAEQSTNQEKTNESTVFEDLMKKIKEAR